MHVQEVRGALRRRTMRLPGGYEFKPAPSPLALFSCPDLQPPSVTPELEQVVPEPPLDSRVPIYSWAREIPDDDIVGSCNDFICDGLDEVQELRIKIDDLRQCKLDETNLKIILTGKISEIKKAVDVQKLMKKYEDFVSEFLKKVAPKFKNCSDMYKYDKYLQITVDTELEHLKDMLCEKINVFIIHKDDLREIKSVVLAYLEKLKNLFTKTLELYSAYRGLDPFKAFLKYANVVCQVSPFEIRSNKNIFHVKN